MIISVSRRTDVPAFYSEWFFNRVAEGFAQVRNPMNNSQIRTVPLAPELVDCFVFWTKNPAAMIPGLDKLKNYQYYFQFTLNPYEQDIETHLPDKRELIDTFRKLSDKIGPQRVIWRYDPILINEKYSVSYHVDNFCKIASALNGYTEKVTISFIDFYSKIERNMANLKIEEINSETKNEIAQQLAVIASENTLSIDTCAEDIDLSQYGIGHGRCIDSELIQRLTGKPLDVKKDKSQRRECGCAASVDIGAYNTCAHGCLYCYANYSQSAAVRNMQGHDTVVPLLVTGSLPSRQVFPV